MKLEVGKAYVNGEGTYTYIMGHARRDDHPDALWSLGADHYLPDGRKLGPRGEPRSWGSLKNLVQEVDVHRSHVGLAEQYQRNEKGRA